MYLWIEDVFLIHYTPKAAAILGSSPENSDTGSV